MTTLTDVRNIAVNVTDQDAALRFYTENLGFDVHVDGDTPAGRWIIIAPRDGHVALSLVANADGAGTDTGIRFGTTDAAASHRDFTDRGVAVSELISWDDMPPMFSFDDPDHNRFSVIEDQP